LRKNWGNIQVFTD